LGDAILIQNAVRNLLDNAIKYSPMDSRVTVELVCQITSVTLSFHDQGLGFPQSGAAGLTKRFARGANVTGIVGSGLGLTIVDEVVRAHGGDLKIVNNPDGVGACVSISFPLS
jgi:two-component system sensor histidine kinase TctE